MLRYHFHLIDGVDIFDSIGSMFANDETARVHAKKLASDYSGSKIMDAKANISVMNDSGKLLFRIPIQRVG